MKILKCGLKNRVWGDENGLFWENETHHVDQHEKTHQKSPGKLEKVKKVKKWWTLLHSAARRHFHYALGHLWGGALISVPDENTLLTQRFSRFYNSNSITLFPRAPFSDIKALKHEFPNLYVCTCHRKWFASLFRVSVILPVNLTTSFQFWRKLLFFLRKVTYFVFAKHIWIWIPYDQNYIFSFVEFPYEGKNLAAYAEEMPTTIYLHMETLEESWSWSIHICFTFDYTK